MGDRVILVGVALGACHGSTHPGGHGGVSAVHHGNVAELLVIGATLVVGLGVAVEGGGDELFFSGFGHQVTSELLYSELVEGFVLVKGADDVVAVSPDGAGAVIGITGGVRVAGEVKPHAGPVLTVAGLGKDAVDILRVGIRRFIAQEGRYFLRGGRDTR